PPRAGDEEPHRPPPTALPTPVGAHRMRDSCAPPPTHGRTPPQRKPVGARLTRDGHAVPSGSRVRRAPTGVGGVGGGGWSRVRRAPTGVGGVGSGGRSRI